MVKNFNVLVLLSLITACIGMPGDSASSSAAASSSACAAAVTSDAMEGLRSVKMTPRQTPRQRRAVDKEKELPYLGSFVRQTTLMDCPQLRVVLFSHKVYKENKLSGYRSQDRSQEGFLDESEIPIAPITPQSDPAFEVWYPEIIYDIAQHQSSIQALCRELLINHKVYEPDSDNDTDKGYWKYKMFGYWKTLRLLNERLSGGIAHSIAAACADVTITAYVPSWTVVDARESLRCDGGDEVMVVSRGVIKQLVSDIYKHTFEIDATDSSKSVVKERESCCVAGEVAQQLIFNICKQVTSYFCETKADESARELSQPRLYSLNFQEGWCTVTSSRSGHEFVRIVETEHTPEQIANALGEIQVVENYEFLTNINKDELVGLLYKVGRGERDDSSDAAERCDMLLNLHKDDEAFRSYLNRCHTGLRH